MIDHNQTKKIFESWNSFLDEAQMPSQLELVLDPKNTTWKQSQENFLKHLRNLKKIANSHPEEFQRIMQMLSQVGYFVKDLSKFSSYKEEGWNVDGPGSMSEKFSAMSQDITDTLSKKNTIKITKQGPRIGPLKPGDAARMQSQEYQRAFRKSQGLPPRITVPSKNNPLGKTIGESLIFLLGLSNMEDFDKIDWAIWAVSWLLPFGKLGILVKRLIPNVVKIQALKGASYLLSKQTPLVNNIRKNLAAIFMKREMALAGAEAASHRLIKKFFLYLTEVYVLMQFLRFIENNLRKSLYDEDDPQYNMLEKRLELIQIKRQEAVDAYEDGMDIVPLLMQLVEQTPKDGPRGEAQEISMKRRKIEQTIKNLKKVKESGLKQDPSAIKFDQEFVFD